MTLATPIWLAAAASVVVPILIHLFGRPRPRLRRFPSLMLLRRAQSERHSSARLRRIVSLILRCLALVLLAVVLAGPLSGWAPLARFGERPGGTAIILDRSPSMATVIDNERSIDRARDAAAGLIEGLPPGEEIVLVDGDGPAAELSADEAAAAVRGATIDDRRARPANDLAALLDAQRPPARLFLLTDGQATSLSAPPPSAPSSTRVIVIDVGSEIRGNSALVDLRSDAPVHLRGRPRELVATARTWGEGPGRAPLSVECGSDEVTVGIDLLPDASATGVVEVAPEEAGMAACVAALPNDALPADNRRLHATLVRERLRVAVIGDDARARFVEAALNPYDEGDPRASVELVRGEAIRGDSDLDAVIVVGGSVADANLPVLGGLVSGGAGALLFAGAGGAVLDTLGFSGVTVGDTRRPDEPLALAELSSGRPPLAPFAEPGAGDLSAARFSAVPDVAISEGAATTVLARYDDGTPALLEGAVGRGRSLLIATSADDAWSDLVRMPEFVPLMHRLTLHLAGGTVPCVLAGAPGDLTVGELPVGTEQLRVVNADDEEMPVESAQGRWRFIAPRVGAYRLQSDGEDIAAFAVNLDGAESDPERLSPEEIRERLRPLDVEVVRADGVAALLERLGPGRADVSSLIALCALLIFAVESVQSLRPRGSADDE